MTSKKFILSNLNDILKEFPFLSFKYEYNDLSDSHFIEILPFEEFHSNEKYKLKEQEISINFIKFFPLESLIFITEGSKYEFQNAEQVFGACNLENIEFQLLEMLNEYSLSFPSSFNSNVSKKVTNINKVKIDISFSSKNNLKSIQNNLSNYMIIDNLINSEAGENNYSLAA
jgi:hypothetical protein